ncbi:MAG: hypothetical protein JWO86_2547 [Myxococcaceae bacterium]|nr:hypothetical protein [Myxococcaceae bacterium]MEA2752119.1 hypothetical protein [Myxococcales bacterium]
MQNRRQFLCTAVKAAAGATVTLVFSPLVAACGSDNNPTPPTTTTNPTNPTPPAPTNPTPPANPTLPTIPGCDGAGAVSTLVLGHTHTVCAPLADLNNPPAGGQTYTTSAAATDGHMHQVILTQAQLMSIAAGQTVMVTTTVVESHTHDFSL